MVRRRGGGSYPAASSRPRVSTSPAPSVSRGRRRAGAGAGRTRRRRCPASTPPAARGRVGGGLGDQQAGDARASPRRAPARGRCRARRSRRPPRARRRTRSPGGRCGSNRWGWKTATTPARPERAGGGERRGDLGRVVGVVVDDPRAGGAGAERLEAPPRALEVAQRRGGLRPGRRRRAAPRSARPRRCGRCGRRGRCSSTVTPSSVKREPPAVSSGSASNGTTGRPGGASASSSGRSQTTAARSASARNARKVSSTSRCEA